MAVATSIIVAAVTAGGLVAGAEVAAHGANEAADTQANASTKAAETNAAASDTATQRQLKAAQDALDFQKKQLAAKQAALAPYGAIGSGAISQLGSGYGLSGGSAPGPSSSQSQPTPIDPLQPAQPTTDAPMNPQQTPMTLAQLASAQTQSGVRPQVGDRRRFGQAIGQWDGNGWQQVEA